MKDTLGDRIKSNFENAFRISIPQRTYGIVRVDGKAFHTFTRGLERPYCKPLADAMDAGALALTKQMMGCKFAYGQSDEYSFLFTDLDSAESELWFGGNIQKISSISASIFTAHFNARWSEVVGSNQKGRIGPPITRSRSSGARTNTRTTDIGSMLHVCTNTHMPGQ